MKRMLLILSCWLFLCPVLAEEETAIPAAMRFQADQAVYCFYNAAIPENAFRQSTPAEDVAAADWYATLPSTGNTFIFHYDGQDRICRITCVQKDDHTSDTAPELTLEQLYEKIRAHLSHVGEAAVPFSNVKEERIYPQWQTGSTFVCEIICGPGARLYDNCVTTIYYDAACDVITHVTFLYLD